LTDSCVNSVYCPIIRSDQSYPSNFITYAFPSDDNYGGIALAPQKSGSNWYTAYHANYSSTTVYTWRFDTWARGAVVLASSSADQFNNSYHASSYYAQFLYQNFGGGIIAPNSNNTPNFKIKFYCNSVSGTTYTLYAYYPSNNSAVSALNIKTLTTNNGGNAASNPPVCVFNYDEGRFELFITVATSPYIEVQRLILAKPAENTALTNTATYTPLLASSTPKIFQCKHALTSDQETSANCFRKVMYGSCINGKYYLPTSYVGATTTQRYGIVMDAEAIEENSPSEGYVPVLDYYLAKNGLGQSFHRGQVMTEDDTPREIWINHNSPIGIPLVTHTSNWICGTVLDQPYVKEETDIMTLYYTIGIGEPDDE
jgi:hypothetical protein